MAEDLPSSLARTDFDRVLSLPSQGLHRLAGVAIFLAIESWVGYILGCDSVVAVANDLFGLECCLGESHVCV
jgi:hypothetical protein